LQSTWRQWQTCQNLHKNMVQLARAITPQRGHIFLWFNNKSSSVFSSLDAPAIHFSIWWLWVKLNPGSPISHWRHLARELTTIKTKWVSRIVHIYHMKVPPWKKKTGSTLSGMSVTGYTHTTSGVQLLIFHSFKFVVHIQVPFHYILSHSFIFYHSLIISQWVTHEQQTCKEHKQNVPT